MKDAHITQGPTLVNPDSIDDATELRAELHRAQQELLTLSILRHMLETSIAMIGNDLADVADAYQTGESDAVMAVAQRVSIRVARCKEVQRAAQQVH